MCQFSCSIVFDSATPWTAAHQASLSITNSQSLLRPMNIELVMPSNHFTLCRPLLSNSNAYHPENPFLFSFLQAQKTELKSPAQLSQNRLKLVLMQTQSLSFCAGLSIKELITSSKKEKRESVFLLEMSN